MPSVIKADAAVRVAGQLRTVDLTDHLVRARTELEEAQRHAAQIIAKAKADGKRAMGDAKKVGYEAGHTQGVRVGRVEGKEESLREARKRFDEKHAAAAAAMSSAVEQFGDMKAQLALAAKGDVLELAVAVARKLTLATGVFHKEAAKANVERALQSIGRRTDVTIRVHPDDFQTIKEFAPTLDQKAQSSRHVSVLADEALSPGGCLVQSNDTEVDATLDQQLDAIVAVLLQGTVAHE